MKSYRKELWFNVPARRGFINITSQVEECLRESGIQEGLVLCNTSQAQYPLFYRQLFSSRPAAFSVSRPPNLAPRNGRKSVGP